MKIFAIILSIYFLGLNFIPCDDTAVSENQDNIAVGMNLDLDQQEEHNSGADSCPPFCECHCCHVHVVKFTPSIFEIFEPEISFLAPAFGESAGKEIAFSHFQPPRI